MKGAGAASDPRTLMLFDVDGVLVHPIGYKAALRALVDYFAMQMGQPAMGPRDDEIAVFEASGLTNEWDSGAMCVSALLLAALEARPDLRRVTLEDTLAAIRGSGVQLPRPDFTGAAREIAHHHPDGHLPAVHYLALLTARTDPANLLLRALLGDVYNVMGTPTTRVFQTYTLGSERFAATYGQPAPFESNSYLTDYDVPLLTGENRECLLRWSHIPGHGAAIFTARPSLPPADLPAGDPSGDPPTGYAPEAELAVELIGLAGKVPLIAQGRVGWLAWRNGRGAAEYIKPSPVQALASIGAAASGSETEALQAAAALVEHGELVGPLAALADQRTRVIVFEDAAGGIRAAQRAVELLQRAGLDITLEGVGVSPQADKRAALAQVADHVVDEINAGLALAWD
ncbi:MAG TPA: hypothetical protein VMT24_03770 [Aggregatilineaceae bacterium]|nr:hypothetical protein [Aggregatilineaceae bacterium]